MYDYFLLSLTAEAIFNWTKDQSKPLSQNFYMTLEFDVHLAP